MKHRHRGHFLLSFLHPSTLRTEICNKLCFEPFLKDLKDHAPYSTIFLSKVSKKDAPTYYDVIKQPMDLGIMTRKLHLYDMKSFYADLDLIWTNCLHFNRNSPFFVDCAVKMMAKTESLKEFYFDEGAARWPQFTEFYTPRVTAGRSKSIQHCVVHDIVARRASRAFVARVLRNVGFECGTRDTLEVLCDVFTFHVIDTVVGLVDLAQKAHAPPSQTRLPEHTNPHAAHDKGEI